MESSQQHSREWRTKHCTVRKGCSFILLKKEWSNMRPAFNFRFTLKRFLFNFLMQPSLPLRKKKSRRQNSQLYIPKISSSERIC